MSIARPTAGADTERSLKAGLWMIGAICSFTSMAVAGRAASIAHDTFEIMLFRSIVGFFIVVTVARSVGTLGEISTRNMGLHVARNLSHFLGQNLWFFALPLIPLAHLFALEFTMPIWVVLLAPFVLGEAITRKSILAVALGFAGVLIVVRPDLASFNAGTIAAAIAAIGFAGSALFTRKLTRTASITCILFWLTALQLIFGLICAGYDGQIAMPTLATLPWLCVIAVAGLAAHFCLTTALSLAPAAFVMPFDFARLPLIAVIGMAFYGEPLDEWIVIGAVFIFVANWVNTRPSSPV